MGLYHTKSVPCWPHDKSLDWHEFEIPMHQNFINTRQIICTWLLFFLCLPNKFSPQIKMKYGPPLRVNVVFSKAKVHFRGCEPHIKPTTPNHYILRGPNMAPYNKAQWVWIRSIRAWALILQGIPKPELYGKYREVQPICHLENLANKVIKRELRYILDSWWSSTNKRYVGN